MITLGYGDVDLAAPVDLDHPDNAGLALWLLGLPDVGGGPVWPDLTGRTGGGTLVGSPTWGASSYGQSGLTLNGTSQYVNCGNSAPLNLTSGGVLASWVSFTSLPTGSNEAWVWGRDDNTLGRAFAVGWSRPKVGWQLQINGADAADYLATPALGQLYRLLVAGNSVVGWRMYLNGAPVATGAWTAPSATTGATTYGERTYSGFNGWVNGQLAGGRLATVAPATTAACDGLAARDYAWSLDPGTDERLRRLSSFVQVLGTGGGTFQPAWAARSNLAFTGGTA